MFFVQKGWTWEQYYLPVFILSYVGILSLVKYDKQKRFAFILCFICLYQVSWWFPTVEHVLSPTRQKRSVNFELEKEIFKRIHNELQLKIPENTRIIYPTRTMLDPELLGLSLKQVPASPKLFNKFLFSNEYYKKEYP